MVLTKSLKELKVTRDLELLTPPCPSVLFRVMKGPAHIASVGTVERGRERERGKGRGVVFECFCVVILIMKFHSTTLK